MPVFELTTPMPVSADELYAWHARPGAFERCVPPWERVEVVRRDPGIGDGARMEMRVFQGPLPMRWVAVNQDNIPGRQFADRQESGPFAFWLHTHRFIPEGDGCLMQDQVEYRLPAGGLGQAVAGGFIARSIERMFRFRHRRLREDLESHARFAAAGPQCVAISGASGLVGTHLSSFLTTGGHTVRRLVRGRANPADDEIPWDPAQGELDPGRLVGISAAVHLSGESVTAGPWTPERKARLLSSRVDSTRTLCEALARMDAPPSVLVCASAIGYYGDRGDEVLTEVSAPGSGFLTDICKQWEAATQPASDAGIRVVHLRIGVVLTPRGGALQKLLPPFLLCAGGPIGSGRQYMSWIDIDDLTGAIHHALFTDGMSGAVNGTAPAPVTNADFGRTLGRVLHRPSVFPLPAFVVGTLFGEMGRAVLLTGQRVLPAALDAHAYPWRARTLEKSLRRELGR